MLTTTIVLPLLLLVLYCCLSSSQVVTTSDETGITLAAAAVDHPQQSQQRFHDRILMLPGQPGIQSFEQYSGYVTVDEKAGRALFYYFVEATDPSFKMNSAPLLLWLNGGPGCSSLGMGAMSEIGPFRVKSDGKTLYKNDFSWNKVANILFLESPVGVGFSYSNTSTDIKRNNDNNTAADSYIFLLNWMERFPEYKGREFYIVGESYSGHYVPQLAHTILEENNKYRNSMIINLQGIALGNPWLEEEFGSSDFFEYLWSHAVISDKVIENIRFNCDFYKPFKGRSKECYEAMNATLDEARRNVNIRYNIYAPLCHSNSTTIIPKDTSLMHFDPCNDVYVHHYLNLVEVQVALHAKFTSWEMCRNPMKIYDNRNFFRSTLSLLPNVMANGVPILVYSGDFDAVVPFMSTKTVLKRLNLTEVVQWSPWKSNDEVAGYHVVYQGGLTFTTIKGAGHMVPSDQANRALAMISVFLRGEDLV